MMLYSFVMQYLGGTYISQVMAESETSAMRSWLIQLNTDEVEGFDEEDKQQLILDDFSDEEPVLIAGCKNVWCFGVRTKKEFALVNFILTQL